MTKVTRESQRMRREEKIVPQPLRFEARDAVDHVNFLISTPLMLS